MKQVARKISTYTADVSGVCSALFELGGMCVMHDASGCNSTYNTHDEPRWYDNDSLVFITGISEMEAIMGDDEKFINDICDTAKELKPNFIAIAGTPIPMMIGTDFNAVAKIIEFNTGIPTFGIDTNGMNSYIDGISKAFYSVVDRFAVEQYPVLDNTVNIIGLTPLDFSVNSSVESIKTCLSNNGFTVNASIAMDTNLENIKKASCAACNLVVSYDGLSSAKLLKERFGTPYVLGIPYGKNLSKLLINSLHNSITNKENINIASNRKPAANVVIIGESVASLSLSYALHLEYNICPKVICPIETSKDLINGIDKNCLDEEQIENELKTAKTVIADPIYKRISPKGSKFIPLPHEAFSGRIYRSDIPDLISDIGKIKL